MKRNITGYDVGAMIYTPGNGDCDIAKKLKEERFGKPFSLAFCLEDTVADNAVEAAEETLYHRLEGIEKAIAEAEFYVPLIFVRIRTPEHLQKLIYKYSRFKAFLTGFIMPKFYVDNCDEYIRIIQEARDKAGLDYYYMPIFESAEMSDPSTRGANLKYTKTRLDAVSDRILNIRVGGNDLCHAFGVRRSVNHTIYDVRPVAAILTDILCMFSREYIVSGPVWEYYGGDGWDTGLRREMELDKLSGFIGKDVIHPNQIPIVNECMKVSREDWDDTCSVMELDGSNGRMVAGSKRGTRMNEYKTHFRWADRINHLSAAHGVKEE